MSEQQHTQTQTGSATESQTIAGDGLSRYLELRAEYMEQLRENDLLDVRGGLRTDVVDALFGRGDTMIPVRGSPMDEYCRNNPEDPLCQRIDNGSLAEQFLDARSEFIGKVIEHDLGEVQRFVADLSGAAGGGIPVPVPFGSSNARAGNLAVGNVGNAGLIGPDQDIDDVPPWLRPYVNPRLFASGTGRQFGAIGGFGNAGLVGPDQDIDDIPPGLRPYVNPRLFGDGRLFSDGTSVPLPFRQANGIAVDMLF
jgi:hypothetical protein